jgi:uncharacterized protein YbcV (DUF1398 family)
MHLKVLIFKGVGIAKISLENFDYKVKFGWFLLILMHTPIAYTYYNIATDKYCLVQPDQTHAQLQILAARALREVFSADNFSVMIFSDL